MRRHLTIAAAGLFVGGCFTGDTTKHLLCNSDASCGPGQTCIDHPASGKKFCEGPPPGFSTSDGTSSDGTAEATAETTAETGMPTSTGTSTQTDSSATDTGTEPTQSDTSTADTSSTGSTTG